MPSLLLGQAPVIGLLLGGVFQDAGLNPPLFLLIFVSLWFGTNNSAKELVGERGIFRREKRSGLSPGAYLASKLLVQGMLTFLQCFLLVTFADMLLPFEFSFFSALWFCWLTSLAGIAIGLCVSAWSKTEVTAIVAVPLILIPFILFGGMLKPYAEMGDFSRFAAFLNPARWGYDAIVQVERDGRSKYDPSPKRVIEDLRDALNEAAEGKPPSPLHSEEDSSKLLAFDEKEDSELGNSNPRDRGSRKTFAHLMLVLMICLAMFGCFYKARQER